jgi:hypothetical protein
MKDCLKLKTNYDDVNGVYDVQLFEFDPQHEENQIEALLASIAPCIKSISLMPYAPFGIYPQMPEEAITEEEYNKRLSTIIPIDWSKFKGDDGVGEQFCTGDKCELQTSSLITG